MRFNSPIYWLFLLLVVAVLWLLPRRGRKAWLLLASYAFYASWHWPYLGLLVGVAALGHWGGGWVLGGADPAARKGRSRWVLAALLVVLGCFKYLDWLVENLNWTTALLGAEAMPLPGWVLPLGISFYVFEALSYVIECSRGKEERHSFWDFQLFVAFFPHLVAGPILRAKELIPQLSSPTWTLRSEHVRQGLWYITSGLFVKIALADNLAGPVDQAFSRDVASLGPSDVVIMAAGFGLQLYFDFSAYSRIAYGSAQLCGLTLVQNFDFPYSSKSPAELWNRWHMSLSRWIRDYLYFTFVGKRLTVGNMARASVYSMVLCGIWHGAGWKFAAWGLYNGLALAVYYAARRWLVPPTEDGSPRWIDGRAGALLCMALMFAFYLPSWIFFRAPSIDYGINMIAGLFTGQHRALAGTFYAQVALLYAGVLSGPTVASWAEAIQARVLQLPGRLPRFSWAFASGVGMGALFVAGLLFLRQQNAFIYFQF